MSPLFVINSVFKQNYEWPGELKPRMTKELQKKKVKHCELFASSGGQSTQIKYLSKSTDTYNKILLQ